MATTVAAENFKNVLRFMFCSFTKLVRSSNSQATLPPRYLREVCRIKGILRRRRFCCAIPCRDILVASSSSPQSCAASAAVGDYADPKRYDAQQLYSVLKKNPSLS